MSRVPGESGSPDGLPVPGEPSSHAPPGSSATPPPAAGSPASPPPVHGFPDEPPGSSPRAEQPRRIAFRTSAERALHAEAVADHLRAGGLIAYPTETVYGFGCALLPEALARLAAVKAREGVRPFLLLVADPDELPEVTWTEAARRLAAAFWPGPLTLALSVRPGTLPTEVVSPAGTVAVRISPHEAVRAILGALRQPITSTSANLSGAAPAGDANAAAAAAVAAGASDLVLVVDGGPLPPSAPSTLVDCAREPARVLRVGAVTVAALRTVLPEIDDPG